MSASTVTLAFKWMIRDPPDTFVVFLKITEMFDAVPIKNIAPTTYRKGRKICLNLQGQMLVNKLVNL